MGLIGLSTKHSKPFKRENSENRWDLSGLVPIWNNQNKSIYAFVGVFEESENFIYKIHLLKQKLDEDFIDYGNANSLFTEGIDYGNSIITDFIGKTFIVNDKSYILDENNFYKLILKISEIKEENIIFLSEVIGYVYKFEEKLNYKNMFYLIVKD